MRRMVPVLAGLAVAGCAAEKPEEVAVAPVVNLADQLSPGCYTVDLFDPYTIEAVTPDTPAENSAFLGVWRNGAWNGEWCHDLYVTRVGADGSVDVLDAYGPLRSVGIEATVFKRRGHVQDGVLTLQSQGGRAEYRREGEYLVGKRKGALGEMNVTMSRQEGLALRDGEALTVSPPKRSKS